MSGQVAGSGWDLPDQVRERVEFHWFHVPPGGGLLLCALSTEPAWYVGHFDKGRMVHCTGRECLCCVRGVGRQIRFVLSAVELSTRMVGVIELGTATADVLKDRCRSRGTLRGLVFELSRSARSKHCRIDVSVLQETAPGWALGMEGLPLEEVLSRTWERLSLEKPKKGALSEVVEGSLVHSRNGL